MHLSVVWMQPFLFQNRLPVDKSVVGGDTPHLVGYLTDQLAIFVFLHKKAIFLALLEDTFSRISIFVGLDAFPFFQPVGKSAFVVCSVRHLQLALPVELIVFPFALVRESPLFHL